MFVCSILFAIKILYQGIFASVVIQIREMRRQLYYKMRQGGAGDGRRVAAWSPWLLVDANEMTTLPWRALRQQTTGHDTGPLLLLLLLSHPHPGSPS